MIVTVTDNYECGEADKTGLYISETVTDSVEIPVPVRHRKGLLHLIQKAIGLKRKIGFFTRELSVHFTI